MIDMALIRPGRFDKIVFVPKPDRKTRQVILEIYVKDKPIGQDVNMKTIADATEGFSGAGCIGNCEYRGLSGIT